MSELLSPAGDFICAKEALYNGADAIYCALDRFGARAYAKNLSKDELKNLLILAHELNKKIYVTVNTIVKENELNDAINFLNELYELGTDGVILADFALINYVIENLPGMEAHISTQAGIKDLEDVLFFEKIKANRCVLARETAIEEIKRIKGNTKMPIEVFAHGALCVSYSGGCLMSSLLTLRSGNRGRCSQNCRREYKIYKNNELIANTGFHLSMKDLNTTMSLKELKNIGVDSLKLEGRMKTPEYVKIVTSEYRKKLDDNNYKTPLLTSVFHRVYTDGFLNNTDNGNIVDPAKKSNDGDLCASIISKSKLTKINAFKKLSVGDRVKIVDDKNEYYFTVDKLYDEKNKEIKSGTGILLLNIYKDFSSNAKIYRMIDSDIDLKIDNTYKRKITIEAYGQADSPLTLITKINNKKYVGKSNQLFQYATKTPIDEETLFKQLSKLNETSFYLGNLINNVDEYLFMTISGINEARRNLIESIQNDLLNSRALPLNNHEIDKIIYPNEKVKLTAFCTNLEQYNTLKSLGIEYIYFNDSYSPYVNAKYEDKKSAYVLAGDYGALLKYSDKEIISDYSFNVINSKAVYDLHKNGVKYVTLSPEISFNSLKDLFEGYKKYGNNPNLEMLAYGRLNLMTMKYCPLKRYGQCGKCKDEGYFIEDNTAKFPIYHDGCITHIINEKPLNLIDELSLILSYVKRIRLQFTIETPEEIKKIVNNFKNKIANLPYEGFSSTDDTRAYFKREIF